MKKLLASFGVFIVLGIIGILVAFVWWTQNTKPVSTHTEVSDFVITRGTNAEKVGQQLYEKGFIKSPLAFKIYVQLFDKTQKVQAGQFKLSPSYSLTQIVDALSKGPTELWVTIPEGLRREEVAEKITTGLSLDPARTTIFRSEFLTQTEKLEGQLFPDTYLFGKDVSTEKVVSTLKNTFDKRLDEQMRKDIVKTGYTLPQIITLASIIERETKGKDIEERPTVAGIYYNRLRVGMPIQADATVQYALANIKCAKAVPCEEWWPTVLRDDYQLNNSYNTYVNNALPPGPIANPGLLSLKAAIYPAESDYLFYIHDEDGKIHYAKTLAEHNQNVARYLR